MNHLCVKCWSVYPGEDSGSSLRLRGYVTGMRPVNSFQARVEIFPNTLIKLITNKQLWNGMEWNGMV